MKGCYANIEEGEEEINYPSINVKFERLVLVMVLVMIPALNGCSSSNDNNDNTTMVALRTLSF